MIHAEAGWPLARDEREPMCGEPGGECGVNPSAGAWGTVLWGGPRAWGMRIGMPTSGAWLLCHHHGQERAAGPAVPQFPQCEDWETVAHMPWSLKKTLGRAARFKLQRYSLSGPGALGWPHFSLVLLGLNTLHGLVALLEVAGDL